MQNLGKAKDLALLDLEVMNRSWDASLNVIW